MAEEKAVKKEETKPEAKKKWSLKKKLSVIFGVVAAVIIAVVIIITVTTNAPVRVANSFLSYVQNSNGLAAYALFSSGAKEAVDQAEFTEVIDQVGPILAGKPDMQSKSIHGETGSAATAEVVYTIAATDSKTYTITINLVNENGEWKVEEFDSNSN